MKVYNVIRCYYDADWHIVRIPLAAYQDYKHALAHKEICDKCAFLDEWFEIIEEDVADGT
jgi:hypothetical protein